MNKAEQISFVSHESGVIKSETEKAIKSVGNMIRSALSGEDGKPVIGKKLKIDGMGTFEIKATKAKSGTNPQVAAAEKANEAGTADEKQLQLLKAVKEGTVKATYEKPAGSRISFKAEAALATWAGAGVEEEDDADGDSADGDAADEEPTVSEAVTELADALDPQTEATV